MSFLTDPTFLIPTVVAVVAVIVAVYFGVKTSKTRDPRYRRHSTNLVKDFTSTVKSVQMLYNSIPISNLTVTKILFWNAGRETIRANDITPADPLRISTLNGGQILEYTLLKMNNPPSEFHLEIRDKATINLSFNFLEKNQGAIIQIFHTGSQDKDIVLEGTVIGGHKPTRVRTAPSFYRKRGKMRIPRVAIAITGLVIAAVSILGAGYVLYVGSTSTTTTSEGSAFALILTLGITYAVIGGSLVYTYFRDNIPQGLEEFREID